MNVTQHLNNLFGKFAKPKPVWCGVLENSKWSKKVSEHHIGDVAEVT